MDQECERLLSESCRALRDHRSAISGSAARQTAECSARRRRKRRMQRAVLLGVLALLQSGAGGGESASGCRSNTGHVQAGRERKEADEDT
ncbi:hypothetical protein EYF80_066758 [Liparis tanakae]|uniref:Uncharacterized protein n=1 Tax=Liparis tanakae TaxID=230148 RepID=A0A4Z2E391_9TELE|nr:hypothetical protein EYF80_066758 [Liparis tanakae]